jgi:hypothetical protein
MSREKRVGIQNKLLHLVDKMTKVSAPSAPPGTLLVLGGWNPWVNQVPKTVD